MAEHSWNFNSYLRYRDVLRQWTFFSERHWWASGFRVNITEHLAQISGSDIENSHSAVLERQISDIKEHEERAIVTFNLHRQHSAHSARTLPAPRLHSARTLPAPLYKTDNSDFSEGCRVLVLLSFWWFLNNM